jgi:hypothetical protein
MSASTTVAVWTGRLILRPIETRVEHSAAKLAAHIPGSLVCEFGMLRRFTGWQHVCAGGSAWPRLWA